MKRTLFAFAITFAALTAPALAQEAAQIPLNDCSQTMGASGLCHTDDLTLKWRVIIPIILLVLGGAAVMRSHQRKRLRGEILELRAVFRERLGRAAALSKNPDSGTYLSTELSGYIERFDALCNGPHADALPLWSQKWKIERMTDGLTSTMSATERSVNEITHARSNSAVYLTGLHAKVDELDKLQLNMYQRLGLKLARAHLECAEAIAATNNPNWQRFQQMINLCTMHCCDAGGIPHTFRPTA